MLVPNNYLPTDAFKCLALDFLPFGNCYQEDRLSSSSSSSSPLNFVHALANT